MDTEDDPGFSAPLEEDSGGGSRPSASRSGLAVASLVSGLLAYILIPLLGSLVAIVTGHLALREIRESGDRLGGRSMARAGLWLGYVQWVLVLVLTPPIVYLYLSFAQQKKETILKAKHAWHRPERTERSCWVSIASGSAGAGGRRG